MKKIKVALIHNIISPSRVSLFNEISKNTSIDLKVFFLNEKSFERHWKTSIYKNKIKFKYKILKSFSLKIPFLPIEYNINPHLFSYLKRDKYDIVVSVGWADFVSQILPFLKRKYGYKFVLWSGSTNDEKSMQRLILTKLVKKIINKSDFYISYGTKSTKYLIDMGADSKKIKPAYNPINHVFFKKNILKKNKIKQKLNIEKNKKVILYTGQLIKRKGLDLIIKALSERKNDYILVVVGLGKLEKYYKNLAARLKVKSIFLGHIEYSLLPNIYSISDLFILPSREEAWGLVVNEAMSSKLPVIVSNKVGCAEDLVKNGYNGYVFENNNQKDLKKKINLVIKDKKTSKKMGENSFQIAKDKGTKQAAKVFNEVISKLS